MLEETVRQALYPLGWIASVAFGARVLLQWLGSEWKKECIVTRGYWQISLFAYILFYLHTFIQFQYHMCLIIGCNGILAWRNLNLMQPKEKHIALSQVLILLASSCLATTLFFGIESLSNPTLNWFRIPVTIWQQKEDYAVPLSWTIVGCIGIALFSSRFWVQWWMAEQKHKSYLSAPFWWISLVGSILTVSYFSRIKDPINVVGPMLGLIPYIRNLMLIYAPKKS
ncbi:MAG: lipid-A-disaccharide synthase N-terminal domain-containing protein [Chlamydiia bacterium]|nr:lipid-A-disaccharide synthase N-terminal domain-containing protein [Chlamydiia bacterium]